MLDASDEVAMGRVDLLENGRSGRRSLIVPDHDIDHVAAETGVARGIDRLLDDLAVIARGGKEKTDIADQVTAGGIEISDHLRHVLEERLEIVDRLAYGDLGDFLVQAAELATAQLVGSRHLSENALKLLLQALDFRLDAVAHVLGQRVED